MSGKEPKQIGVYVGGETICNPYEYDDESEHYHGLFSRKDASTLEFIKVEMGEIKKKRMQF